jgi:hypothetical protein
MQSASTQVFKRFKLIRFIEHLKRCVITFLCYRGYFMATLQDIERAIGELSPSELEELYTWLDGHYLQQIDAQLRSDLDAGRFDERIERALADHKSGSTRPL